MPDTANIFSTFPSPHLSLVGGAGDQVLATALLAISVCSARQVTDLPAVVGLTVLGLGVSLGYNCGYPLNPARDLGPRIFMCKILVKSGLMFTFQEIYSQTNMRLATN